MPAHRHLMFELRRLRADVLQTVEASRALVKESRELLARAPNGLIGGGSARDEDKPRKP